MGFGFDLDRILLGVANMVNESWLTIRTSWSLNWWVYYSCR